MVMVDAEVFAISAVTPCTSNQLLLLFTYDIYHFTSRWPYSVISKGVLTAVSATLAPTKGTVVATRNASKHNSLILSASLSESLRQNILVCDHKLGQHLQRASFGPTPIVAIDCKLEHAL